MSRKDCYVRLVGASVEEAPAGIGDGATVVIGGFTAAGSPTNLIQVPERPGPRNLTAAATNVAGELDPLHMGNQLSHLIASLVCALRYGV